MKRAYLLHPDRSFNMSCKLPSHGDTLVEDLELNTLVRAMSQDDPFLRDICLRVMLTGAGDAATIAYRQEILKDCLENPGMARGLYALARDIRKLDRRHAVGLAMLSTPSPVLSSALELLKMQLQVVRKAHALARKSLSRVHSRGLRSFLEPLAQDLDEEYLTLLRGHLRRLEHAPGFLLSAGLGPGNMSANYVLHKNPRRRVSRFNRLLDRLAQGWLTRNPTSFLLHVDTWDESSNRALDEMKRRGAGPTAHIITQSVRRIHSVFGAFGQEMGFYIGCLNLAGRLGKIPEPITFPEVAEAGGSKHAAAGLYDPCLALITGQQTVANDIDADGKNLVVITGANQGGKTTFLRSIGLAQLMMQCGMFVPARSYCSDLCTGLFTHYSREEDIHMESGKLDEELRRMSESVDHMDPHSLILLNESFAATNEREGSSIAEQVVLGLRHAGVKVFFVTHLYEFAQRAYEKNQASTLFLRAERRKDGRRTFKMVEAEPLETSHGKDLYDRIFSP